jgi:hypothetical protein
MAKTCVTMPSGVRARRRRRVSDQPLPHASATPGRLLFGYAALSETEIRAGIRRFAGIL